MFTNSISIDKYKRNGESELKYFGSDFNKYLHSLSKEMSIINIDTIQFKRSKKIMRIIEFKHTTESNMDYEQHEIYHILDTIINNNIDGIITKRSIVPWKINVYLVRGDSPFNKLEITNLTTNEHRILIGEDIKKWCEFEIDF